MIASEQEAIRALGVRLGVQDTAAWLLENHGMWTLAGARQKLEEEAEHLSTVRPQTRALPAGVENGEPIDAAQAAEFMTRARASAGGRDIAALVNKACGASPEAVAARDDIRALVEKACGPC